MRLSIAIPALGLALLATPVLEAGSHTWRVNEVFSNADGTIQFIELRECCGSPNEIFLNGRTVESTATASVFQFTANLSGNTSNAHILLATTGFAALPGAPTPDHIIPDGFVGIGVADGIGYIPYDTMTIPAGMLPTDGITALQDDGANVTTGTNSPTNFAGVSGTIDASGGGPIPEVDFALTASSAPEAGGVTPILVRVANTGGATADPITVEIADAGTGTATSGTDYTAPGAIALLIPAGSTDGMTFPVDITILDDGDAEGLESIALTIVGISGGGAVLGANTDHIVTITDDDGPPPASNFVRGDVNQDGSFNIADPVRLLAVLFQSDPVLCDNAGDMNDDNALNIADAVYGLGNLFSNGPDPAEPFGVCGSDPTPGPVTCVDHQQCP